MSGNRRRYMVQKNPHADPYDCSYWDVVDTKNGKPVWGYEGIMSKDEAEYNAEMLNKEVEE